MSLDSARKVDRNVLLNHLTLKSFNPYKQMWSFQKHFRRLTSPWNYLKWQRLYDALIGRSRLYYYSHDSWLCDALQSVVYDFKS